MCKVAQFQIHQPLIFLCVAIRPNAGYGLLIHEISRSHSAIHTTVGRDSSGRVISPSQRPLPVQHTALTTDRHPCPPVGSEPTISVGERPQAYASDWDRLLNFRNLPIWLTVKFYNSLLGPKVNILNTSSPMVANQCCFSCRNSYEPLHASYWFVLMCQCD